LTGAAATGALVSSFLPQAAMDKQAKTTHKRRLFMMPITPKIKVNKRNTRRVGQSTLV
jgi:hypothetical protein